MLRAARAARVSRTEGRARALNPLDPAFRKMSPATPTATDNAKAPAKMQSASSCYCFSIRTYYCACIPRDAFRPASPPPVDEFTGAAIPSINPNPRIARELSQAFSSAWI
jgi:hypothetical protein